METTYVREKLGLDLVQRRLVALFPASELVKGLTRIVEDLKTGKVTVPDLYRADDRRSYIDKLPSSLRPKASTRLKSPVFLDDLSAGTRTPRPVARRTLKAPRRPPPRTTVIPSDAQLNVTHPRINKIYYELTSLSAEQYPNACGVLLRVFLELSVDHYLVAWNMTAASGDVLAKRIRVVAADLEKRNLISKKVRQAAETVASSKTLGPGLASLHQYVHNEHVYPGTIDLFAAWDTVQPMVEQLWPT